MKFGILLLCVVLPVFQENQKTEELRSTSNRPIDHLDSVQLPETSGPVVIPGLRSTEIPDNLEQTDPWQRDYSGSWQLSWNDDLTSDEFNKTCVIKWEDINGVVQGDFVGEVAGRERQAIISGRHEGFEQTRILTFQQREKGYVCSYQATDRGGAIQGVWHDTQNRSGRFQMLKYQ